MIQVVTLVGGLVATMQTSEAYSKWTRAYKQLYEETHPGGLIIDFGLGPNSFVPLIFPILLGLVLTVVLLIDQVRHATADSSKTSK
jgi:hypothetical protein